MLKIHLPEVEGFDNSKQEFITLPAQTLEFEHSLATLSEWESKWELPFLGKKEKTIEQTLDYFKIMLGGDIDDRVLQQLRQEDVVKISEYIRSNQTATWFNDQEGKSSNGPVVTAEVIYYWMVSLRIPFECQHWHLNKLLTLIKVINQKSQPAKKMNRKEALATQRSLNEQRRLASGTNG